MNRGLVNYLNEYMLNPDPQYAVMINGKWGCGKTFFIKKWLNRYKESENEGNKVLTPIYVSLYGLKTLKQITTAINQVLYPILYGKAAKAGKTLLKFASAIVFKQDVDINGDDKDDLSIGLGLDSFSILKSDDENIKSDKFLIFDDIERCQVNMKELLGYINYFIEHCNCHVLIIGDEGQIEKDDRNVFERFKEKTIGREFLLNTEIDTAIDFFVKEELGNSFLISHIESIKKTFKTTECHNLRILRQCLWDFSRLESLIKHRDTERYNQVLTDLLCTYIATYCEYKGENNALIKEWREHRKEFMLYSKDETVKSIQNQLSKIQNKYNAYSGYAIFNLDIVEQIVGSIESGVIITDFVDNLTKPIAQKPSWEKRHDASVMTNDEFKSFYNELLDDIIGLRVLKMADVGNSIAYISYYDAKKIRLIKDEEKQKIKESLPLYWEQFKTQEACYDAYIAFKRGIHLFESSIEMPILAELCEDFYAKYEKRMKEGKNDMTMLLENLDDIKSELLFNVNNDALPDKSTTYDSISIFKDVNIDLLFLSLTQMSNRGRHTFNSFLRHRYKLAYNMGDWTNKTEDDVTPLNKLKEKIDEEISKRELMEKYSFELLSNAIAGAIKRCTGNLNAQAFG